MNDSLVTFKALQQWTGYERPGDICQFLKNNNIRFFEAKGRPVTTLEHILKSTTIDYGHGYKKIEFINDNE